MFQPSLALGLRKYCRNDFVDNFYCRFEELVKQKIKAETQRLEPEIAIQKDPENLETDIPVANIEVEDAGSVPAKVDKEQPEEKPKPTPKITENPFNSEAEYGKPYELSTLDVKNFL